MLVRGAPCRLGVERYDCNLDDLIASVSVSGTRALITHLRLAIEKLTRGAWLSQSA